MTTESGRTPVLAPGTVALVTGASSGIGAATVRRLAARGCRVVAVARREAPLQDLAAQCDHPVGCVLPVRADITDSDAARACVGRAVDEFGQLDILVNNAGIMLLGPFETSPVEDWTTMMRLNVEAMLHLTQEAIPQLRKAAAGERGVADIVNVGSVAGRVARGNFSVYAATKFGVTAFSESLRQELGPAGIRVCCVEPGQVATELLSHVEPGFRERLLSGPIGASQAIEADDVAATIEFLVGLEPRVALHEIVIRSARAPF
jgi:NADP-dependent 3-hydroxy acid dehydrogenase YdfG